MIISLAIPYLGNSQGNQSVVGFPHFSPYHHPEPMKLVEPRQQPELNLSVAAELGRQFREEREAQKLSAKDAGDKLLLSKSQVLGLEAGDDRYFYGARLYAQSADKYARQLGLTICPTETLLTGGSHSVHTTAAEHSEPPEPAATNIKPSPAPTDCQDPQGSVFKSIAAVAILIVLSAAGLTIVTNNPTSLTEATPNPASAPPKPEPDKPAEAAAQPAVAPGPSTTPAAESTPATAEKPQTAASAVTTPEPAQTGVPAGKIVLVFKERSWVQVVHADGSKQNRTYQQDETLTLDPSSLQAVIIGNARGVAARSKQGEISLTPYMAQGSQVARLIGAQIRQLGNTR